MDDISPESDPTVAAAAAGDGERCTRCGGNHTKRQRCPLDLPEPPAPEITAAPPANQPTTAAVIPSPSEPAVFAAHQPYRTPPIRVVATVPQDGFAASLASAVRWLGAITGTAVLFVCVSIAGVLIADLTKVHANVGGSLFGIFVSIVVGMSMGMLLIYVCQRVYAKVVFALLSLTLMTAGFLMMVLAPVLRQMNTPSLAEYQAFDDLLSFGVAGLIAGLALAAICFRWAMRPHALRRLSRWSRLLASAYGVMLGISGLFAMFALFTLINGRASSNTNGDISSVVQQAIGFAAIGMWSFVPGLLLTYQGISASMGEPSAEFRPPVAVFGIAAFGAVLLVGHLNMSSPDPIAAPMPVLHVLAAAIPGLTFAAMAGRGSAFHGVPVRWLTWRQVTLAMAIAMTLGVQIALYVETLGSFGGVVLMLVHNGAFEFARNSSDFNQTLRDSRFILSRNEQFVAGLITASICAPLAEEFGKSIGVRIMFRSNTTRAQAFQMGAFAGAGFGFLEAMLYGLGGIGKGHLSDWWQIMLLRGGSTSLHVLCTGLAGLGWWYWSRGDNHRRAIRLFATAIALHALWNAAFTMLGSRIFGLDTLSNRALTGIAYTIVAVASIAFITAIPLVARAIRDREPPTVEGTPLASLTPWLA